MNQWGVLPPRFVCVKQLTSVNSCIITHWLEDGCIFGFSYHFVCLLVYTRANVCGFSCKVCIDFLSCAVGYNF